jgi:hypothetical protein
MVKIFLPHITKNVPGQYTEKCDGKLDVPRLSVKETTMLLPSSLLLLDFLFQKQIANISIKLTTPTGTAMPIINPVLLFPFGVLGGIPLTVGVKSEQ